MDCVLYLAGEELLQTGRCVHQHRVRARRCFGPSRRPRRPSIWCWPGSSTTASAGSCSAAPTRAGILARRRRRATASTTTRALFASTGTVKLPPPQEHGEQAELNGEEARWIRVRIEKGDYGEARHVHAGRATSGCSEDDRPLRPPALKSITFRYREDYRDAALRPGFNDFACTRFLPKSRAASSRSSSRYAAAADEVARAVPRLQRASSPTASRRLLPAGGGARPRPAVLERATATCSRPSRAGYSAERASSWAAEQRVVWEYWDGASWVAAGGRRTRPGAFTRSGFRSFSAPRTGSTICMKFTEERFWLRARLEMGGYVKAPRIRRILSTWSRPSTTSPSATRSSAASDASPLQQFSVLRSGCSRTRSSRCASARRRPRGRDRSTSAQERRAPGRAENTERGVLGAAGSAWKASSSRSRAAATTPSTTSVGMVHALATAGKGQVPPEGKNKHRGARRTASAAARCGNVNPRR